MLRLRWVPLAGLLLAVAGAYVLAAFPFAVPEGLAATAPRVALRMTFDDGQGDHSTARLTCRGSEATAKGYLGSRPAKACRKARRIASFLASQPSDTRPCDQVYGGPARARIRGRIGGRAIDRSFSRADGCEIADWDRAGVLLPASNFRP
jgi:hypothetical protein